MCKKWRNHQKNAESQGKISHHSNCSGPRQVKTATMGATHLSFEHLDHSAIQLCPCGNLFSGHQYDTSRPADNTERYQGLHLRYVVEHWGVLVQRPSLHDASKLHCCHVPAGLSSSYEKPPHILVSTYAHEFGHNYSSAREGKIHTWKQAQCAPRRQGCRY